MNTWGDHLELHKHVPQAVPLCLHCLEPVDPLDQVCPHCGATVGQLTPYLPFESIRWSSAIWGQMWQQVWHKETPILGRVFRLFVIIWFVPFLLVGFVPPAWRWVRSKTNL